MTISSVAPTIDASGISAPSFADILAKVTADYQGIFGADVYIAPDSQDGQFIATIARGFNNLNNAIIATYNAFSPTTAQGAGLSSVIKINGLQRKTPSFSTALGTVTGTAGVTITNGKVADAAGNTWSLPSSVTIDAGGTVSVTVTCDTAGAIAASSGAIATIRTPVFGWTGFTNTAAASQGAPVESDAAARTRQSISTAAPSQSMTDSIRAAVAAVPGVTRLRVYENATNATDANGIPAGNTSVWVENGDSTAIATAIAVTKPPGSPTYGGGSPVTIVVNGVNGSTSTINFGRPTNVTVAVNVSVKQIVNGVPITSGTLPASTIAAIQASVQAAINAGPIGLGVVGYFGLVSSAALIGNPLGATYEVSAFTINKNGGSFAAADIALAYNEVAVAGAVTVTVL